jgi:5-methylcytosine-specific restriction endonuclease McrA
VGDVLVLNSSYEALSVTSLRRAVRLIFAGKAELIEGAGTLRSTRIEIRLPSVIRMLYYVARSRHRVGLSKKNLLLRDDYRCQYCSVRLGANATVDHVVPRARGGLSAWNNLVACCVTCNQRKRDRTPDEARMTLTRRPKEPSFIPWVVVRRHTRPDEWFQWLTLYNVSIEERVE